MVGGGGGLPVLILGSHQQGVLISRQYYSHRTPLSRGRARTGARATPPAGRPCPPWLPAPPGGVRRSSLSAASLCQLGLPLPPKPRASRATSPPASRLYLGLHDRLDLPHTQSPVRWRERRRRRGGGSESIAHPAQAQPPQPARRRQPVPSEQATARSIQSSTADPAARGQRNARVRDRPPLAWRAAAGRPAAPPSPPPPPPPRRSSRLLRVLRRAQTRRAP